MNQEEQTSPPEGPPDIPREQPSTKSYGTAVILSGIFGVIGVHHFYLGRWFQGGLDVCLTIGWAAAVVNDEPAGVCLFLAADLLHTLIVTIMLLTGSFRDGEGQLVAYPNQKLPPLNP